MGKIVHFFYISRNNLVSFFTLIIIFALHPVYSFDFNYVVVIVLIFKNFRNRNQIFTQHMYI